MFIGINIVQTKYYIKIDCHTYIDKFCEKYLETWLCKLHIADDRLTPLPTDRDWIKAFNAATGLTDTKEIAKLECAMNIKYRGGVGELI